MITKDSTYYLVGYEVDNDFCCEYETLSLDQAREYLKSKTTSINFDGWCIYEKRIAYKIKEMVLIPSREEKPTKSMVSSM